MPLPDWFWLLAVLVTALLLSLAGRWIHRHLHGLGLLITGKQDTAIYLYAIPLLPGVAVHELSHGLMALALGVRTGGLSLFPQRQGDGIRLGSMAVAETDKLRGSLIGAAPLIGGGLVAALVAQALFGAEMGVALRVGGLSDVADAFAGALHAPVWALYLLFAIANALWPSPTDRRDWTPVVIGMCVLVILAVLLGVGSSLAVLLKPLVSPVVDGLRWLSVAFALVLVANVPFVALIALAEWCVGKARGQRINYGNSHTKSRWLKRLAAFFRVS